MSRFSSQPLILCPDHQAEYDGWLFPSPATLRATRGTLGIRIDQVGNPRLELVAGMARARDEDSRALRRVQLARVAQACRSGQGCSS